MNRIAGLLACLLLLLLPPDPAAAAGDRALYWAISRDGEAAGFLLGTIHSEDPRVLDFPDQFIAELTANPVFAMEMVPDLPTLTRLTEYMHYQDGTTLESRIGADRYARLRAALADYRVPDDWVRRMKVWAAMMTLSVPPPETGLFMDFSLSLRAAGAGMQVVGLETLEEQLSFLEDMPMAQQLSLLDQALDDYRKVADIHTDMVDRYVEGDLERLVAQSDEQLAELPPETRAYFVERGIVARNHRMFEALLPRLEQGRVFVAVGALHLPGDSGLIALLREQGYAVTPLPLPFLAPEGRREADDDGDHPEGDAP
jgi:uncharacterized protein YbaP (TraB family)